MDSKPRGGPLEKLAKLVTSWAGTSWAFALALGTIVVWGVTGPLFQFNETWQLVINTGTTIVTFLMIFLVQRTQNNDSMAINLKLNELLAVTKGASNRLINIEDMSEKEIQHLHKYFSKLVELAKREQKLTESHSIEEEENSDIKEDR
jgi:low affinity Fe/Cu permease